MIILMSDSLLSVYKYFGLLDHAGMGLLNQNQSRNDKSSTRLAHVSWFKGGIVNYLI